MNSLKKSRILFGHTLIILTFASAITATLIVSIPPALANPNCDPDDNNKNCPSNNNDDNHGNVVKGVATLKVKEGFHGLEVSTIAKQTFKPVDCTDPMIVC